MMNTSQLPHRDADQTPLDERLERIRREQAQRARDEGKAPSAPSRPLPIAANTPLEERLRLARERCKDKGKARSYMCVVRESDIIGVARKIGRMPFEEYYRLSTATKINAFPEKWPSHVPIRRTSEVGRACDFIRTYYERLGKDKLDEAELEDVLALIDIVSKPLTRMSFALRLRWPLATSPETASDSSEAEERDSSVEKKYCILPDDSLDFRLEVAATEIASPKSPLSQICLIIVSFYANVMKEATGTGNEMSDALHLLAELGFGSLESFHSEGVYSLLIQHPDPQKLIGLLSPYTNADQASFMEGCLSRGVLAQYLLLVWPWGLIWRQGREDNDFDDSDVPF